MVNVDVRTRVELKNETQRERTKIGTAGNVALIGAFPSSKQRVFAARSFAQLVNHYNVKLNSNGVYWYSGVRTARRLFMEGIKDYGGASSVTCVNICKLQPDKFSEVNELYKDTYSEEINRYNTTTSETTSSGNINPVDKYVQSDSIILDDTTLTFEKLKRALQQIADEDMDLLFIANDLNEIFANPMAMEHQEHHFWYEVPSSGGWDFKVERTNTKGEKAGSIIVDADGKPVYRTVNGVKYLKPVYNIHPTYIDAEYNEYFVVDDNNNEYPTAPASSVVIAKLRKRVGNTTKDYTKTTSGSSTVYKNGSEELVIGEDLFAPGASLPRESGETKKTIVFYTEYAVSRSDGTIKTLALPLVNIPVENETSHELEQKSYLDYDDANLFKFMVYEREAPKTDENGETLYGETDDGRYIRNLGDVYNYILDFIDNEFTNHRPITYIGAIKTTGVPEGNLANTTLKGVASKYVKLYSSYRYDTDDVEYDEKESTYNSNGDNPYWNIKEWGALEIANLFTRTTNELSTCGLFYQSGIVNGEEVDSTELAAHICGWLCSLPISQDLTYQTIPALTDVKEEPYFGEYDAGKLLNEAGIQVIRPKSRLEKTYYVNNSIQPTGWHTNHVRSVIYLLKRLHFETGLGMNNYIANTEAYRAVLDTASKEVMDECDVIRSVEIGKVEVLSHYHIYVPISIVLAGVVTLINIGVSMALDETGTWGTYIKTTSGYSVNI